MAGFLPSNIGNMFGSADRLMGQANYNQYDPSGYINPALIPYLQMGYSQDMMRQQFNMYQPQQALPQNFGAFLGGLANKIYSKFNQSPPPPDGQLGTGMPGAQGDPVTGAINRGAAQFMQAHPGSNYGEALAMSAQSVAAKFPDDPGITMVAQRAIQQAKTLGWDPSIQQSKGYESSNYLNRVTQEQKTMSAAEWASLPDRANWMKSGELPQEPMGKTQSYDKNGQIVTERFGMGGAPQQIATSTQPAQFIRNVNANLTGDEAARAGLLGNVSTAAESDKLKAAITNREIAVKNLDQAIGDLQNEVKAGGPIGHVGTLAEHADDVIGSVKQIAGSMGDKDFERMLDPKTYKWQGIDNIIDKLQAKGVQATKIHSMMLSTAYLMEAAEGHTDEAPNSRISRIQQNMVRLGEETSDPAALVTTLENTKNMFIRNLQNEAEAYGAPLRWYGKSSGQTQAPAQTSKRAVSAAEITEYAKAHSIGEDEAKNFLRSHGYKVD